MSTTQASIDLVLDDEAATTRFGQDLALALRAGDLVLLNGDLGAGKTFLTRACLRAAANDELLEVPSPTFTLMQVYEGLPFGALAHFDLYRLGDQEELTELGLEEAIIDGVAFVEWPERGGLQAEQASLVLTLFHKEDDSRIIRIEGSDDALQRLQRSLDVRAFLNEQSSKIVGLKNASRHFLTGDASSRSYEHIKRSIADQLVLMNAPEQPDGPPVLDGKPYSQIAHLAENLDAFVAIGNALRKAGLRVPEFYADDLEQGFLLIEDLGTGSVLNSERIPLEDRYRASVEALVFLHRQNWPSVVPVNKTRQHKITNYDRQAMAIEIDLMAKWYLPYVGGDEVSQSTLDRFHAIWAPLINHVQAVPKTLVLRDFHSPNIIWQENASGIDRVGLIDFQDAVLGPEAYDLASLAQDARVDVSESLETSLVDHYCALRGDDYGFDETAFRHSYAIMAAQRATKVLGIFVRLSKRDGKHQYLAHLPRIENYLKRSLAHPALAELASFVETETAIQIK